jgi:hypothetical protein
MKFEEQEITSIGDFSSAIRGYEDVKVIWYRGQRDESWQLQPSIARSDATSDVEHMSIKRFKQNALPFITQRPADDWEWMFLMQHHRAPTRLLDWSESAMVALYFALEDSTGPNDPNEVDAAVWCLDPVALNANAGHKRKYELDILAFGVDEQLNNYLPDRLGSEAELDPVAGIGPRNSARMVAQAGTFTITHAKHLPIEGLGEGAFVWRMVIPFAHKVRLKKDLEALGVNELLLFPDLDRVAMHTGNLLR